MGCNQSSDNVKKCTFFSLPDAPSEFRTKYKLNTTTLGKGGFAVVQLATKISTGELVAVKCFDRKTMASEDEEFLRTEITLLRTCDHPNIVKFYDFFEEQKYFFLVMELLEGGELLQRIIQKMSYSEREARDVIFLVLSTIQYCHDKGIVHRDLKPENLLLKDSLSDTEIKLVDFGFAACCEKDKCSLSSFCGSPGYTAPEILKCENYGAPVDMWSIGVILYTLIGGRPPFHDETVRRINKRVREGNWSFDPVSWASVSEDVKDLIRGLLTMNPDERLTAEQALKHPWMVESAGVLASRSLDDNFDNLKKFVGTHKFRAAVRAVVTIQRLHRPPKSGMSCPIAAACASMTGRSDAAAAATLKSEGCVEGEREGEEGEYSLCRLPSFAGETETSSDYESARFHANMSDITMNMN